MENINQLILEENKKKENSKLEYEYLYLEDEVDYPKDNVQEDESDRGVVIIQL